MALLRQRVAEQERARAASDTLCRSLAEETRQLRRTLAATAHMCQHLAQRLEARPGAAGAQRPEVGGVHRAGRCGVRCGEARAAGGTCRGPSSLLSLRPGPSHLSEAEPALRASF